MFVNKHQNILINRFQIVHQLTNNHYHLPNKFQLVTLLFANPDILHKSPPPAKFSESHTFFSYAQMAPHSLVSA